MKCVSLVNLNDKHLANFVFFSFFIQCIGANKFRYAESLDWFHM